GRGASNKRLIGVISKLQHGFEIVEHPVVVVAGESRAQGMGGDSLPNAVVADDDGARGIEKEIVSVRERALFRLVNRPDYREIDVVIYRINVIAIGNDRLHPESIDVELLVRPISANALERAAGIGPIQRADQSL